MARLVPLPTPLAIFITLCVDPECDFLFLKGLNKMFRGLVRPIQYASRKDIVRQGLWIGSWPRLMTTMVTFQLSKRRDYYYIVQIPKFINRFPSGPKIATSRLTRQIGTTNNPIPLVMDSIVNLPGQWFEPNCSHLIFKGNLKPLCSSSFSALKTTLTHLGLHNNNLEELQGTPFIELVNLKTLDLSGNRLHTVAPGALKGLNELTILDLSGNQLKSLAKESLTGLRKLQRFYIENNPVKEFVENPFVRLQPTIIRFNEAQLKAFRMTALVTMHGVRDLTVEVILEPGSCCCCCVRRLEEIGLKGVKYQLFEEEAGGLRAVHTSK